MRRRSATLTAQELEIMKIIWQRESATVRDVYEVLLESRKVAYTTVMTMMKILEQKKYLKKTQLDRAYVYRPAQPQRQVVGAMVRDFVNRVFNGSAEPLLVHLVEEHNLSREDLDEIATLREESRKATGGGEQKRREEPKQ
jgi:predicted transcriptional regulator